MSKLKNIVIVMISIFITLNLSGCGAIDNIKKKVSGKNEYFNYMNTGKVEMISIQSVRDPAFKFIVTDEKAIANMYELLTKAKISDVKSDLESDYIFEINMGEESKKFNYVVGEYEGNFYNDDESFTVSKRLDEGIIQNLSFIRKPRDFEYIYYNSILDVMNLKKEELNTGSLKIGIDIQEDIDCLKYIFSADLDNFIKDARKITPNVELVKNNESDFDIIFTIKNRGYSSTIYKSNIIVKNKLEKKEEEFYVTGENEFKEWNIKVYDKDNIPKEVEKNW